MCTSISFKNGDNFYFGRNLDLDTVYGNEVTVTPRNFPFHFKYEGEMPTHYAIIGMALVANGYPLYFDGTNEKGLSMAGLNFRDSGTYYPAKEGMTNVTTYEFIPYMLAACATVREAREVLANLNLTPDSFAPQMPAMSMHWVIADENDSIVIEPLEGGLKVYDDPVHVLTNNPTFDYHIKNLINYMNLTPLMPKDNFAAALNLKANGVGVGTFGLPGGYDGVSRFVRAAFNLRNSVCPNTESDNLSQFFRVLNSVAVARGVAMEPTGEWMITQYSSCCNVKKGIYYFMNYDNYQINGVDLFAQDLDANQLEEFPAPKGQAIAMLG